MELFPTVDQEKRRKLIVLTFVFITSGILLLTLGLSISTFLWSYSFFLPEQIFTISRCTKIFGFLLLIIPFVGYYKLLRGKCFDVIFYAFIITTLAFEFFLSFSGFLLTRKVHFIIQQRLFDSLHKYGKSPFVTFQWDTLQLDFNCCGIRSFWDWEPFLPKNKSFLLPLSCCDIPYGQMEFSCNPHGGNHLLHYDSCLWKIGKYSEFLTGITSALILILILLQLITLIKWTSISKYNITRGFSCRNQNQSACSEQYQDPVHIQNRRKLSLPPETSVNDFIKK